jgi:hypothetical protein
MAGYSDAYFLCSAYILGAAELVLASATDSSGALIPRGIVLAMQNEDLLSMTPMEREEERRKCGEQHEILWAKFAHPEENLTESVRSELADFAYALGLLNERIAAIDDLKSPRKRGIVLSFDLDCKTS